jgi:hypothetical protein
MIICKTCFGVQEKCSTYWRNETLLSVCVCACVRARLMRDIINRNTSAQNMENTDLSDVDGSSTAVVVQRYCRYHFVLLLSFLFLLLKEQKISIELSSLHTPKLQRARWWKSCSLCILFNPLTPNDHYSGRTAPLTYKRCILYIYSTNIVTEYFKHGVYSLFFPLQNAVCSIILTY